MNVVIVGGGFCGTLAAKRIEKIKDIDLTLIDEKTFFEYTPNLHKTICNPSYVAEVQTLYQNILPQTNIISEKVISITPTSIQTETQSILYDYLILTIGIKYPIQLKQTYQTYTLKTGKDAITLSKELQDSNTILIVGGGLIGCEIAGELCTKMNDKKIILIHSQPRLLTRNNFKASTYVDSFLKNKGVEIIYNEKVLENKKGLFITDTNREILADLCIWSAGISYDSSILKGFSSTCFDSKNAIKVNASLQLYPHHHIFVGGDITAIPEEKTARKAELHAKIIAKNIQRDIKHKPLIAYSSHISPMIISLGDAHGIIEYFTVYTGPLPANLIKRSIERYIFYQLKKGGI